MTPQALSVIRILEKAFDEKGLHSEDYDGPRWKDRVARLSSAAEAEGARFDAALTVCTMRYISDLHIGRVNPQQFAFGLDVEEKKYNLPEFLRQKVINAADPQKPLDEVEPPFAGYQRAKAALMRYFEMARKDDGEQLPAPAKTLAPGAPYAGVPRLVRLLQLLGDLARGRRRERVTPLALYARSGSGGGENGIKERHGLQADGRLGAQTVKSLEYPLTARDPATATDVGIDGGGCRRDFPEPPVVVKPRIST